MLRHLALVFVLSLSFLPACAPAHAEDLDPLGPDTEEDVGATEDELRTLPSFKKVWNNYPRGPRGEDLDAEQVKKKIGGNVDAAWITNTCVIRISYALNRSGFLVPANARGLSTVRGGDDLRYAFRVKEMESYLRRVVGAPNIVATNRDELAKKFSGKKGIIMFKVDTWSDASGHFDLWDGTKPAHDEYFLEASKVMLWTLE